MKAALEASYHAGEATEPDWVREERALHKVDDQMARDVKSEATKSCNLRVLAQPQLGMVMSTFTPEIESDRVMMTLFRVVQQCGDKRITTKKTADGETPVSLETLGTHGCWFIMKTIKKYRGTFHPQMNAKFESWIAKTCEDVVAVEVRFSPGHLQKIISKVWSVMADKDYIMVAQKTVFNSDPNKKTRKKRSDAGTKRARDVTPPADGANVPPNAIPVLPPLPAAGAN